MSIADTCRTTPMFREAVAFYSAKTLDIDRWFRVADADYLALLATLDLAELFPPQAERLRLLDVGCGSGRFPALLRQQLGALPVIEYDFLDPSPYSLQIMVQGLTPPFEPGEALAMRAEDLGDWRRQSGATYDIVWAIHSLYFGLAESVPGIINNLAGLLVPETGTGLIYIASRRSFYLQLHNIYRQIFTTPIDLFLGAEQYAEAFEASELCWHEQKLCFFHEIAQKEQQLLESYLHKCVLDQSKSLSDWRKKTALNDFVEQYRENEVYRFPQEVSLFRFKKGAIPK